jgi:hypothetical protein
MTQPEKQMASKGSNFLDGYIGGKRSKKTNNRRRYNSRK